MVAEFFVGDCFANGYEVVVRKKLSCIIPGLVLLILWLIAPAQGQAADNGAALAGSISIQQSKATADFPNSIKFEVSVKIAAAANLQKTTLNYQLQGNAATSVHSADLKQVAGVSQFSAALDTNRSYIPPGTHLSYYWEFTDKSGAVFDSPTQELAYQDKRFAFQELSQGVVTVRWYQGSDAFGHAALDKALTTIDRLGREYNIKPTKPINITIYPDTQAMFTALPPNTAEWVGGQAMPTLGTIVLAIPPGNMSEIGRSIPHEVTHQVNYQATKNPYNYLPKWLDEGLAVYNQDQVDGFLNQAFQRGIDKQSLIPLRVLNGSFPADSQQSYMSYGESYNVIKYILKRYGNAGLERILASFKNGVSYDEAVQQGLGIGLDELDRQWKDSFGYAVGATGQATSTNVTAITTTAAASTSGLQVTHTVSQVVVQFTGGSQTANSQFASTAMGGAISQAAKKDDNAPLLEITMALAGLVAVGAGVGLVLMGRKK